MTARHPAPTGYFALNTEILGADRILDVHFDWAPDDPAVDYRGYVDVTKVLWNGVDITGTLSPDDLQCIAEDIPHG